MKHRFSKFVFLLVSFTIVASTATFLTFSYFLSKIQLDLETKVDDTISSYFGGGTGTESSPFTISTTDHFKNFITLNNRGYFNENVHFSLTASLDFSDVEPLVPIGTESYPFEGFFEGNFNSLTNIKIYSQHYQDIGVFGYVGFSGEINNLLIVNPNIDTTRNSSLYDANYDSYTPDSGITIATPSISSTSSYTFSINKPDGVVIKAKSADSSIASITRNTYQVSAVSTASEDAITYVTFYQECYDSNNIRFNKVIDRYQVTVNNKLITKLTNYFTDNSLTTPIDYRFYDPSTHGFNIGLFCGHLDGNANYIGVQGGTLTTKHRMYHSDTGLIGLENQERVASVKAGNRNNFIFNFDDIVNSILGGNPYYNVFDVSTTTPKASTSIDTNGDTIYKFEYVEGSTENFIHANPNNNVNYYKPGNTVGETVNGSWISNINNLIRQSMQTIGALRFYAGTSLAKYSSDIIDTGLKNYALTYNGIMNGGINISNYTGNIITGWRDVTAKLMEIQNSIYFGVPSIWQNLNSGFSGYVKFSYIDDFTTSSVCNSDTNSIIALKYVNISGWGSDLKGNHLISETYTRNSIPYSFNLCSPPGVYSNNNTNLYSVIGDTDDDGIKDSETSKIRTVYMNLGGDWNSLFGTTAYLLGLSDYKEGSDLKLTHFELSVRANNDSGNAGGATTGSNNAVFGTVDWVVTASSITSANNWPTYSSVDVYFDMKLVGSNTPTDAQLSNGMVIIFTRTGNTISLNVNNNGSYDFTFYRGVSGGTYTVNSTTISNTIYDL